MNDLFNPEQRRSVANALKMFEENLRQIAAYLDGAETNGILYQRKLSILPERRQSAQERITKALDQIATLAKEIGLEPEVEDPAGLIRSEMSMSWVNLLDIQSSELKNYGEVDPRLPDVLDSAVRHLARLALELASIFDD